ncbi:MAG: hypothetical protein C0399_11530 [Syntrophus sp. (in: bacteria)]|nr:hypothetical protein [Syntrophus sp. (in: bacteria)]MBA4418946.1 hypothetical protein [Syntrophus sp. (in: bacteria)]
MNRKNISLTVLSLLLSFSFTSIAFSAVTHKVKQGDNLYTIAKKYQISVDKLKNTNNLKTINLKLGQQIVIEKNVNTPKKEPINTQSAKTKKNLKNTQLTKKGLKNKQAIQTAEKTVELQGDGEFIEYRVKKGDTLERVAIKFGLEKEDILESNSDAGKKLPPGKVLLIPKIAEVDNEEVYVNLNSNSLKTWKSQEERYMLVKVAKSFMGAPYKYGGNSVRGLDCSAYVKKIYDLFDVQLPRSAREQFMVGPKISKEELSVGDLVFFRTKRYVKYPTHVGIYIGDGNFIHSSSAHDRIGVRVDSIHSAFYTKTFTGATRIKKTSEENQELSRNSETDSNNS